jgi:tetratricopeptide (TPR) repeat protein
MGSEVAPPEVRAQRLRDTARATAEVSPVHAHLLAELISQGKLLEALETFEEVQHLPARSADALEALAFYAQRLGLHNVSNDHYRQASALEPHNAKLLHNLATSERSLGRMEEAIDACNRAIQIHPDPFPSILLRSECVRARPDANHLVELRDWLARAREPRQKMFLGYALGKELHDLGDYNEAFPAFAMAAQARRSQLHYDVQKDVKKLSRIIEVFQGPYKTQTLSEGPADHIFIVGLPRTGTTLTERILSGLNGVVSNGETDNFSRALMKASPAGGEDIFSRAQQADSEQCNQLYCSMANPRNIKISTIDKLPLNYLYVGPILRSIARARIIWINRDPVDSCFAMWRTLFAEAYPFSYDFRDLACYFDIYSKLQAHWHRVAGSDILDVDYAELVSSPSVVGQRMAEHCGLEWTDEAVDISRVKSASLTASAAQVREGIYTSSNGIWQQYERHLTPLITALRPFGLIR